MVDGLSMAREALEAEGQRALWAMLGKLQVPYLKTHMFDTACQESIGCEEWGPDALQQAAIVSATGILENSLRGGRSLFMQQLGPSEKAPAGMLWLKELCWVPLLAREPAEWLKMVVCYC